MGQHQCTYTMFGRVDFKWKVKDVMDYGRKTLFSIHLDCEKDERKWTNSLQRCEENDNLLFNFLSMY